jgi:hypothetical protein
MEIQYKTFCITTDGKHNEIAHWGKTPFGGKRNKNWLENSKQVFWAGKFKFFWAGNFKLFWQENLNFWAGKFKLFWRKNSNYFGGKIQTVWREDF